MNSNSERKSNGWLTFLIPLLAVAAGTAVGGATAYRSYQDPVLTVAGHEDTTGAKPSPVKEALPRVYVPDPVEYDFGVMARNEKRSHSFKVQNIGSGPLTLKVLDTTCKCTVGSLGQDSIMPGKTEEVTLTWEAKSYDREFRQSATIETNDKNQREMIFSVYGKVIQLAMPDLPLVKFTRISRSEPQSFHTNVYGFRDSDLVITGHHCANEAIADYFTVKTEPLPRSEWPTNFSDITENAKSAVKVSVGIKPGLPLGIVRQIIKLTTNKRDISPIDVTVDISVVSDISVIGSRDFDDEKNTLSIGPVSRASGHESRLFLMVKGIHKDEVDFTVNSIDPASALEATIGEPASISDTDEDGNPFVVARRFPLTISVKKDSPVMQRLGSKLGPVGRVVLNTKHPEVEQFDIKVRFETQ